MAQKVTPIGRPQMDLRRAITQFHKDCLEQLHINVATQQIWPTEVYPGYKEVNAKRKRSGGWYSTGRGARSFEGRIVSADEMGDITLEYSYLAYMRFAEIGVGAGVKAGDVERGKNVKYQQRYISSWDRSAGRSHRPAIRAEVNHLATRIENYLLDFYGEKFKANIVNGLTVDADVSEAMRLFGIDL